MNPVAVLSADDGTPASFRSTRVGFHRTLQERWFALFSSELRVERGLAIELKALLLELDEACSSRTVSEK